MPVNWQGISGGLGRGADGAAPVFMDYRPRSQARQSVASAVSLTTLRRKCGTLTVGGDSRGGPCRFGRLTVSPQVRFETTTSNDRNFGGMERA